MTILRIPASLMRGGTSKGVFFLGADLPADPARRDAILLRVVGSPDPYGKQIDGLGGATSSTSKVVIISPASRPGHDVDYHFGAVAVGEPVIDWSGNCGNLSAAVGPFAIRAGLVAAPASGFATVRIWQANIGKTILARVPMANGAVQEEGDFRLDGVTFPAAEIQLEFLDPAGEEADAPTVGGLFPTGRLRDWLAVPGHAAVEATLINAGNPTIFVRAGNLGLTGIELQPAVNGDKPLLARCEQLRAAGAVAMGLAATPEEATRLRPHTPKLAFVAPPATYVAADGRTVPAGSIGLNARILSMGALHHAMTGTGAVAIAAAAAIPGTLVREVMGRTAWNGEVVFGHPSGTLRVGASVAEAGQHWRVASVRMSRSARCLMEGWVRVPQD